MKRVDGSAGTLGEKLWTLVMSVGMKGVDLLLDSEARGMSAIVLQRARGKLLSVGI